jgi:hypothetical protein
MVNFLGTPLKEHSGGEDCSNCLTPSKGLQKPILEHGIPSCYGLIYGMVQLCNIHIPIYIPLQRIIRSPLRQFWNWTHWKNIFTYLCWWKHTNSSVNWTYPYNLYKEVQIKINDHIYGVMMDTLLQRLINTFWAPNRFIHLSDGYGIHLANKNTKFSFGSRNKTDSTREVFLEGKTCTWVHIHALLQKKHL